MKSVTFGQDVLCSSLQRKPWATIVGEYFVNTTAATDGRTIRNFGVSVTFWRVGGHTIISLIEMTFYGNCRLVFSCTQFGFGHDGNITKRTSFTHHFLCHRILKHQRMFYSFSQSKFLFIFLIVNTHSFPIKMNNILQSLTTEINRMTQNVEIYFYQSHNTQNCV